MKHRALLILSVALSLSFPARAQKPELVVETGHTSDVQSAAFSRDGRILASGSEDGKVKLWDVATGRELRTLTGHTERVDTVAFSPDGRILASGSRDETIRLWNVADGHELRTLAGHSNGVFYVSFSFDAHLLASGADDGIIKLWDVETGRELRTVPGRDYEVASAAFSNDGMMIASGGTNGKITLWNAKTGVKLRELSGHTKAIISIAISPDGRTLASGSWDKTVSLWDVASGRRLQTLEGHSDGIFSLSFSPDGRSVASSSHDGTIRFWDLETGRELRVLKDQGFTLALGSDWSSFASVSNHSNNIDLFDVKSGREVRTLLGRAHSISSVSFSPDGRTLASGSTDGKIKLWDLESGRELRSLTGDNESVFSVSFSADGRTVAGSVGDTIKLWDAASGRELRTLTGHANFVQSVSFSSDGRTLASGSFDKTIKLWDVQTGRELRSLTGHTDAVSSVSFSPDGRTVASGDTNIKLWDVATGRELRTLNVYAKYVESVTFSPDGRTLASGDWDNLIKLWDVGTGRELRTLSGHTYPIRSVSFSPNGQILASGSDDNTIRLWDVDAGRELQTLSGHDDQVMCVAFSPIRRFLTSGARDGSIRFWDAASGNQLAALIPLDTSDWAVIDPAGRFDASPGGMKLMHWVVGLEPIDLDQLKERYYEPGLLQKVLGFNKEPLHDVPPFTDVKLFPEATVETPSPESTKLVLNLKNRGGGLGRVQVFVNGKELVADARGPKLEPTASHAKLTVDLAGAPIKPGEPNDVRVVTWNQEGYLSSRGVEVEWNPGGERDLTPPALYAIAVGISEYASPELNLHFASKDAADMVRAIDLGAQRLLGADRVHLTLLTSPANNRSILATKENIRKAFEAARRANPDDILVVYLAGHGVAIHDTYAYPAEDARTLDFADPAIRAQTAITSEELAEWMKLVPALHQVMIIDTCAAGAAAENLVEKRDVPGDQVRAIERLKDRTGVFVLMGSAADAASYEASQFGQGLLTYSLLKGMKGAALRDDQYVDVARLFHNAEDEVPELARHIGGVQQPRIASPGGASFDIGKLLAEDRTEIPLASAKPILVRPEFINVQLHRDNLGLSTALRNRLREESYASTRGGGAEMPAVFVDQDDFPGAVSPSGDYTVEGTKVRVTLVLARDDRDIAQVHVEGATNDLNALAERLAVEIDHALSSQPASPH